MSKKPALDQKLLLTLLKADTSVSGCEKKFSNFLKVLLGLSPYRGSAKRFLVTPMPDGTIIVVKGKPRSAIFAHLDTVGYTVGYNHELINIGWPNTEKGDQLIDEKPAYHRATVDKKLTYTSDKKIPPGTRLSFDNPPVIDDEYVKSAYLDDRIGMYIALETLRAVPNVAIAFTTREEMDQSGAVSAARYLADKEDIIDFLIADITWATEHIKLGNGVVISARDETLPKRRLLDTAINTASLEKIKWQLEIESSGMSDGHGVLQSGTFSGFCFIGVPIKGYHSPREKAALADIVEALKLYKALVRRL